MVIGAGIAVIGAVIWLAKMNVIVFRLNLAVPVVIAQWWPLLVIAAGLVLLVTRRRSAGSGGAKQTSVGEQK